jgi:hypothetical protein
VTTAAIEVHGLRKSYGGTVLALGWCVVLTLAGYLWSMALDERRSVR